MFLSRFNPVGIKFRLPYLEPANSYSGLGPFAVSTPASLDKSVTITPTSGFRSSSSACWPPLAAMVGTFSF